jgi:hypothetical protein
MPSRSLGAAVCELYDGSASVQWAYGVTVYALRSAPSVGDTAAMA